MGKKTPSQGGCWYCGDDTEPMLFTTEFDSYIHEECLRKQKENSNDLECQIICNELFGEPTDASSSDQADADHQTYDPDLAVE